jgi:hypothetical protein
MCLKNLATNTLIPTGVATTARTRGTPMRRFAIATGAAGALAAAALGLAGAAGAAPSDLGSAADTVKSLQDQGYNVMLNGTHDGPLSECSVTGIHPTVSGPATQLTSV